jgi:hypothetical protein
MSAAPYNGGVGISLRRLFGYPGFAMLFFVTAAGGGNRLAITILRSDRDPRTRGTR